MIRQICPSCFVPVEFADSAAGTTAECPSCRKPFAVPGAYAPTVAGDAAAPRPTPEPAPVTDPRPAPPPGLVRPTEAPRFASPAGSPPAGTPPPPDGRGPTLVLSPVALDWLPVSCFTLLLVLTFFSWVGLYPGGFKAYAQTPWAALAGVIDTNHFSEEVLQIETPLTKLLGSNWVVLVPYLLAVLLAVVLGWADRVVTAAHVTRLPGPLGFVEKIWPYRFPLLAGLAVGTLVLLGLQLRLGFGLDTATRQLVANDFAEALQAADNSSARQKILVKQGMKLGQYELQTTVWLTLAVVLHVTAVVAAGLRLWLYRRGTKPLPRVTFSA